MGMCYTVAITANDQAIATGNLLEAIVEYLTDDRLHLSGDGHCDSPAYSAKFATDSLMDSATDLQFSI